MKSGNENDLQKLTEAVSTLNQALVASNKRTALLERIVRWGAVGLVAVATIAGLVVNDAIDTAYATEVQSVQQNANSVIEALEDINQNLAVFGQMGQMMNTGFQEAPQNPKIRAAIEQYINEHPGTSPEQAMMALAGGVMADAFVVMYRIAEDSDKIHPFITENNINTAMETIVQELHLMNGALRAIPHMAANMNVMGHSMGKMGSWMPWAP